MKKILIIQTASLGDVILATSVAETLHCSFPACKIDFLLKKGYENLFEGHPFINKLIVWNKKARKYRNLLRIIVQVRNSQYDAVINIHRHFSSGLVTAFSGAGYRSGFSKNPLSFAFSPKAVHKISDDSTSEHEIIRNYRLIAGLAGGVPEKPRLYPTQSDEEFVNQWRTGKYITISPASLWFTKQYPVSKWIELVNSIDKSIKVYLLGANNDGNICNQIIRDSKNENIINLAGKLSFLQSAALMKGALMNFVNDSAPLHLASATNAPVTAVFCSTVPAYGFGPLSSNSTVVESPLTLKCRPCGLHGHKTCPEKHFLCAETINNEELTNKIRL